MSTLRSLRVMLLRLDSFYVHHRINGRIDVQKAVHNAWYLDVTYNTLIGIDSARVDANCRAILP